MNQNKQQLGLIESDLTLLDAVSGTMLNKFLFNGLEPIKNGKANLVTSLTFIIQRGVESFNVGSNITEDQAFTMALDLIEIYKHDTLEDIVMMFKMARQGKFGGKIFRIDSHVILSEWFPAYLELKAEELEKVNRQKSIQIENKDIDNDRAQYLKYIIEQGRGNKPKKDYGEVKKKIDPALAHSKWLERLPKICEILNLSELIQNQTDCKKKGFLDAVEIYEIEINKRKKDGKNN